MLLEYKKIFFSQESWHQKQTICYTNSKKVDAHNLMNNSVVITLRLELQMFHDQQGRTALLVIILIEKLVISGWLVVFEKRKPSKEFGVLSNGATVMSWGKFIFVIPQWCQGFCEVNVQIISLGVEKKRRGCSSPQKEGSMLFRPGPNIMTRMTLNEPGSYLLLLFPVPPVINIVRTPYVLKNKRYWC